MGYLGSHLQLTSWILHGIPRENISQLFDTKPWKLQWATKLMQRTRIQRNSYTLIGCIFSLKHGIKSDIFIHTVYQYKILGQKDYEMPGNKQEKSDNNSLFACMWWVIYLKACGETTILIDHF